MQAKIENLIKKYAELYHEFERLQEANILAKGDQKTGVIGEYYAKCYIQMQQGIVSVNYAKAGDTHDLTYKTFGSRDELKIQVKCVSAHSKTRTIAPINLSNNAFDELYLISLDEEFKPIGFYINTFKEIEKKALGKNKIAGARMTDKSRKDGKYLNFNKNQVNAMREILGLSILNENNS
ncbi:hypothetical protein [Fluviicola taffensis]|uniref:DUF4365 domain-containing protein n=1 Tax=Fluviicola taffensis (strain DSM 16823 / NCIMB 13979 / RW262) TaxID=755732 RepID=F2IDF5_FLUTR|nr:hypothetical protein [Fluviicola taffensis]AEA42331.1 hypothetical protein Fluta_0322 [Fluviicola taffensis DSM 16823]